MARRLKKFGRKYDLPGVLAPPPPPKPKKNPLDGLDKGTVWLLAAVGFFLYALVGIPLFVVGGFILLMRALMLIAVAAMMVGMIVFCGYVILTVLGLA